MGRPNAPSHAGDGRAGGNGWRAEATMRRRDFLAGSALLTASLATRAWARAPSASPRRLPNLLFILTDQQHAGMMSCAGNRWLSTPNMDRLAREGMRFEQAVCSNPVCIPSRLSLQTGRMPSAIGLGANQDSPGVRVPQEMIRSALAPLLSEAGYQAVYGGKEHLPPGMSDVSRIGYRMLTRDKRRGLADECARFFREPHDRPFFLFASFINPHDICHLAIDEHERRQGRTPAQRNEPSDCARLLADVRASGALEDFVREHCPPLPDNFEIPAGEPSAVQRSYVERPDWAFRQWARRTWTADEWRLHHWMYHRLTEVVDRDVGVLLDALQDSGLADDTLVIFASDHGELSASHRLEQKSIPYEEALRVPWIMRWPGVISAGSVNRSQQVNIGLDLLPTLCDYAGREAPNDLPGRSVRPLAEGRTSEDWPKHQVIESHAARVVRGERFKYVCYSTGEDREQLTDLHADPGEMRNLAADPACHDELLRQRSLLRAWVERWGDAQGAAWLPTRS